MRRSRPKLVSFSGIDGAGKSTQISALSEFLKTAGYRWKLFTFWDDVVAFSKFRETSSLHLFRGDRGVGSPERPIQRRDKNVTSWPVLMFRLFAYAADALRLRMIMLAMSSDRADVVVFDRYIYDEWANLPLSRWVTRVYIRLFSHMVPKPDVAILLDADPEIANKRKPEYPLEFVRRNRQAYLDLSRSIGMMVAPPGSVDETAELIKSAVSIMCKEEQNPPLSCQKNPALSESGKTQSDETPFLSTTSSL